MNTCKLCGFIGEPEFFRSPTGKVCKECYKKQNNKRREKNREEVNKYMREYYRKNSKHILGQQKECRENNREKINERKREDYRKNREDNLKRLKEYRENNREKINERQKESRVNNPEIFKEYDRKYYKINRKDILERKRKNREENREEINKRKRIASRKKGVLPWSQIKHLRLGLYIEQTIARMFGSVAEVTNNPGVDFICPNGYKMQVKAASITYSRAIQGGHFPLEKIK